MSNSNSVVACGGADDDPRSLRERMLQDLQFRGMSQRTRDGYLREVRKLAIYYNTSPDKLTEQQVGDYLLHLIDRNYAPGSLRVAYSGIKFFYKFTEPRDWDVLRKLRIPKQKTLPSVLTIHEVHQIIAGTQQFHHAAFFWTLYTLGLRLEEGLNLQPRDLDATRMMVHVHRGKGAKDRYLPLPTSTLNVLRVYWTTHRHPTLLFPARGQDGNAMPDATRPMGGSTVQGCMKLVVQKLGLQKNISPHTLRHSMASHLFEAGVSLCWLKKFLGHASLQTTLMYLHLTDDGEEVGRDQLNVVAQPGTLFDAHFHAAKAKKDKNKPDKNRPDKSKVEKDKPAKHKKKRKSEAKRKKNEAKPRKEERKKRGKRKSN